MKINVATYLLSKPELEYQLKRAPTTSALEICGMFAATCSCPLIAALYYAGEIRGFSDDILAAIEAHMKFYIVTDVEGVSVEFRRKVEERRARNSSAVEAEQTPNEEGREITGGEC